MKAWRDKCDNELSHGLTRQSSSLRPVNIGSCSLCLEAHLHVNIGGNLWTYICDAIQNKTIVQQILLGYVIMARASKPI